MDKPKTIFKYERISDHSLQNVKAQSIYFASPSIFNDPYDCTITARVKKPTVADLHEIREAIVARHAKPKFLRFEFAKLDSAELRRTVVKIAGDAFESSRRRFLSEGGVSCFAEKNDDLLMWSHYGDSHKGFCLEFRTDFGTFEKLRRVAYSKSMPQIDLREFSANPGNTDFIGDLYCTKASEWSYEQEWRLLRDVSGLHAYEQKELKAIYFGPRMDNHAKEQLRTIAQGLSSGIELWQVSQAKDRFELEFKQLK